MLPMVGFEEISLTLPDGYKAYGRYWSPGGPIGAVLYHHGIQSHCGWYQASAACLVSAGYAVLQTDRRGSGRNEADRGHAESAEQLIGDVGSSREELTRRSSFSQHHVVGISWGGKLAVAAYVSDPTGVATLSLVTPGLFPLVGVHKTEMARIGFAMLYDRAKLFEIPLNDSSLFTTAPEWREFIDTDRKTLGRCTAGFYLASRRMDRIVAKLPKSRPVDLHLLIAGDERIINTEKTTSFVRELRWPGTRITRYDRARHSLEFEADRETYFSDLVGFIKEARPEHCEGRDIHQPPNQALP